MFTPNIILRIVLSLKKEKMLQGLNLGLGCEPKVKGKFSIQLGAMMHELGPTQVFKIFSNAVFDGQPMATSLKFQLFLIKP